MRAIHRLRARPARRVRPRGGARALVRAGGTAAGRDARDRRHGRRRGAVRGAARRRGMLRPRPDALADARDLDSSRLDVALASLPAHEVTFQHGPTTSSGRSRRARPRPACCCARPAWPRSRRPPTGASACPRRRRSSIPSSGRAWCSAIWARSSHHGRCQRARLHPQEPSCGARHHARRRDHADVPGDRRRRRSGLASWSPPGRRPTRCGTSARCPYAALCAFPDRFFGDWVQVEGPVEIVSLPDAMEPLVEYYRRISGEHPDWAEYRAVDGARSPGAPAVDRRARRPEGGG